MAIPRSPQFATQALWNMRPVEESTAVEALAITQALRTGWPQ